MEDRKIDEFIERMEQFIASIDTPEKAMEMMQGAGILNRDGEYTEPYKNLCTPQEPA